MAWVSEAMNGCSGSEQCRFVISLREEAEAVLGDDDRNVARLAALGSDRPLRAVKLDWFD